MRIVRKKNNLLNSLDLPLRLWSTLRLLRLSLTSDLDVFKQFGMLNTIRREIVRGHKTWLAIKHVKFVRLRYD